MVSIHTPTKGVTLLRWQLVKWLLFQSTHPRRVWLYNLSAIQRSFEVSIHTPTKGVTYVGMVNMCYATSFNPHTHEGCDPDGWSYWCSASNCFNPHTHEGCDNTLQQRYISMKSFNPHTHEGCDVITNLMISQQRVSIHTPTKGVTPLLALRVTFTVFQSTHPRRVWHYWTDAYTAYRLFQSTHPRRVWPRPMISCLATFSFNPHTHEGCDPLLIARLAKVWRFNPHTHEGCDPPTPIMSPSKGAFQSTHPRRVWLSLAVCV